MGKAQDSPPPLAEPTKRAWYEIEKSWGVLKKEWRAVLSIAVVAFVAGFGLAGLAGKLVVDSKNASIEQKNATIETLTIASAEKDKKLERVERENEALEKQITDLKVAVAETATPLKKRTLTLAKQLASFCQGFANGTPLEQVMQNYSQRFPERTARIAIQLDEVGQHSEILQHLINDPGFYAVDKLCSNVMTLSKEFERLANNLPN